MIAYGIVLPHLSTVAFSFGPLVVKWYALAYILGILHGYFFISRYSNFTQEELDGLCYSVILGIVLGGRLGYVFIYNPSYYIAHPLEILMLWRGGMAFHGGLIGVLLGISFFSYRYSYPFLQLTDLTASSASFGILLGRVANFINGELYGRVTNSQWGVIFPNSDELLRHPVQLYEGFFEGLLLFIVMQLLFLKTNIKQTVGILSGIWLISYGVIRMILENFREADLQIGYFFHFITMGQILSLPMVGLGIAVTVFSVRNRKKIQINIGCTANTKNLK